MKIIISADDFGRSPERNKAIDFVFNKGLIKSIGLLVNADYTKEAVNLAIGGGYLNHLHCHFNIVSGIMSGNSSPLSELIKSNNAFCDKKGEFRDFKDVTLASTFNVFLSNIVFDELEKQYLLFLQITEGKGNGKHIDFHLWNNYRLPVSIALKKLIKKYDIKTFRQTGLHHKNKGFKYGVMSSLSAVLCADTNCNMIIPSSCIDFHLHSKEQFLKGKTNIFEAYCHPNYINSILMDDTVPVFSKKRIPIETHIKMLGDKFGEDFVSWEDL